jgi:hypothetical protein
MVTDSSKKSVSTKNLVDSSKKKNLIKHTYTIHITFWGLCLSLSS